MVKARIDPSSFNSLVKPDFMFCKNQPERWLSSAPSHPTSGLVHRAAGLSTFAGFFIKTLKWAPPCWAFVFTIGMGELGGNTTHRQSKHPGADTAQTSSWLLGLNPKVVLIR